MKIQALSQELQRLIEDPSKSVYQLGDLVTTFGDRAFGIVLLLLSLPSALPIPATGISTPLGFAMTLIGFQMILGRRSLWLPERVLKIKIGKKLLTKMVAGLNWILGKFEKVLHPRFGWTQKRSGIIFIGVLVICLSVVMQAPIPLTNTLPAAVIFCLSLAQMEEDGLFAGFFSSLAVVVIAAYIFGFVAILFFGFNSLGDLIDYLKLQFS